MDKKEKYINYIVDDLLKKVILDYDRKNIIYDFLPDTMRKTFNVLYFRSNFIMFPYEHEFNDYVTERYGASGDDMYVIWDQFIRGVKEMVDYV
tara:strand:+ start:30 stop:308 length:279 start_codon:yes stop_codon:yes gene_type:complete